MYPRYPDVLRTIQQNLVREVIPDLSNDYAREQATGILVLIEHLVACWDREADTLRKENEDLRRTLRRVAAAEGIEIESEKETRSQPPRASSGEELIAQNRELRASLATIIADAPAGSAALRLAEQFMKRQLERETKAVTGVAPTWD